ncbi:MAG TPA: hypothetical protein VMZ30_19645 [Pyrinomonadaceae bacterium]|nr:hypothetical protein [Pyrinomonadaceae bacterium]
MNIKIVLLFLLTSLTYFPPSYRANTTVRCLNEPKSVKLALKQSAATFVGEVLQVRNGRNYLEARFRVESFWKGVEADEVFVLTEGESIAESPHYRVGQKYLVFAGMRDGQLFTGGCSRTKKVDYASEDLEQLEEGQKPKKKQE